MHLNLDHRYLSALPEGWSYEEGAAFLVQVLTAYYGLKSLMNLICQILLDVRCWSRTPSAA